MKRSRVVTLLAVTALALTGCGGVSGAGGAKIGVDFPRSDSDFWNSYNTFVPAKASSLGVTLLPPTNSNNDIGTLVANVQSLVTRGAKAIVMAPQDTGAIKSTLDQLDTKKIPVVSVDTRPDAGKVFMVVRADNKAYGEKACSYLGEKLHGAGNVVEFQGDLASINGRDRSEAFASCMKAKYPKIVVHAVPTEWKADKASAGLQTVLSQTNNNIQGIYMQAGGVFLAPTIALLKQKGLLKKAGTPGHIQIVSNDGIKQELTGIQSGDIDATVSQPADTYAYYGLFYAKAALAGKTFKPGPTDHGSTIIQLPNGLEDQLPAPLVTVKPEKIGAYQSVAATDKSLWANQ
ncbi:sugar ABC transporter substrate-binding protein [Fodinicola acaciae]|uniref:sugar ABC transporter substrate-binding protein n=1 Tax=Fodinicola acaciae TaxID=2681555 RepID=UPI0013D00E16|nr:sugar ABC transporter substrate-binding protein [Fodinicola acaciae]